MMEQFSPTFDHRNEIKKRFVRPVLLRKWLMSAAGTSQNYKQKSSTTLDFNKDDEYQDIHFGLRWPDCP